MSTGVQFDEQDSGFKYRSREILGNPVNPKIIQFLVNKKIVKNEKTAISLLVTITVLFLCISAYIFVYYVFDLGKPDPKERDRQILEMFEKNKASQE